MIEGQDVGRNRPHDRRQALSLPKDIDSESGHARNLIREVIVQCVEEADTPFLIHDLIDQRLHVLAAEVTEFEPLHVSMNAHDRGSPHRQVEVGASLLEQDLQELINLRHVTASPLASSQSV